MAFQKERIYSIDDIYALPDGERAELIDGRLYMMAPPSRIHQKLVNRLSQKITNYIDSKQGHCEVYPAPFAVFLNKDDHNYVEPDLSVVCDMDKLDDRGCNGALDWIIEIASPSNQQMDYEIKLFETYEKTAASPKFPGPRRSAIKLEKGLEPSTPSLRVKCSTN